MDLKDFNRNARCSKCGHNEIGFEHSIEVDTSGAEPYPRQELMKRFCKVCGHSWKSYCLDHGIEPVKERYEDQENTSCTLEHTYVHEDKE